MGCAYITTHERINKITKKFTIIRTEGGSKVITITSFIPKDWKAVEVHDVESDVESVTIKIQKVK